MEAINIIEVRGLVKRFGDNTAIDGIDFSVKKGEVMGIVGPNGAGKTTLIKILCTLLKPTSGTAKVAGCDVIKDTDDIRRIIGFVMQRSVIYENLTPFENIEFVTRLYGVHDKNRIDDILKSMGIYEKRNVLSKTLSGGMKQRLSIAMGIVHDPAVLFLDEPTSGLDVRMRGDFWEIIKDLKKRGLTVVIATHYMDEAEFCDRIAVMDSGRIVALGTPDELKGRTKAMYSSVFLGHNLL